MIVGALILFFLYGNLAQPSGIFKIGFADNDTYQFVSTLNLNLKSMSLVLIGDVTAPTGSDFNSLVNVLRGFHAIIGHFNYLLATACSSAPIAYFIVDEQIDRSNYTQALLDFSLDDRFVAGSLNYILTKYGWAQNLRYISDSSKDALDILWSLSGLTINQCNFQSTAIESTISECFQTQNFVVNPGQAYIVITDDNDKVILDKIMNQFLLRSLAYNSFIFFAMANTKSILIKYHYSGGVLYSINQINNNSQTKYSLVNTYAQQSLLYINETITFYNINGSISPNNLLSYLQNRNGTFKANGERQNYIFYWSVLQNMTSQVPQLVSQISYNGTYSIKKSIPDPTLINAIDSVNAVYIQDSVFAKTITNADGTISSVGFMQESLNLLLPSIRLAYVTTEASGQNIIGRQNNSVYTGMLYAMFNNSADMTAFPIPIVPSYSPRFVYSQPAFVVSYSILIKDRNKTLDLVRLAEPYSAMVWIVILVVIVFLSFILWLTNLISPNVDENSGKLNINNSLFIVIGSFLVAKMLVKPNMISTQLFYLLIWLSTLLLIASYVANLTVSLAFQTDQNVKFTTFANLLNQTDIKWVFLKDSILYNQLMDDIDNNNMNSIFYKLYNESQNRKDKWNPILLDANGVEAFLYANYEFALLNDEFHNLYYSLSNCSLNTITDDSQNVSLAYLLQPQFKYQFQLNQQLNTLESSGTLNYLRNKYFRLGLCPITPTTVINIVPLDLSDMAGLFILIVIGIVVSFPAALIEYLLHKTELQLQRTVTSNTLKFGHVYSVKVASLDKNGVTVDLGQLGLFAGSSGGRFHYINKKYLGGKRKNKEDAPPPTEMGIMIGTRLLVKYMGNNPLDSKRIFVQVQKRK